MVLFQFKWLRRFVRSHTNPIPQNRAELWKQRLSIGYAILAWHAFGLVCYMFYTGRGDWASYYGYQSEQELNKTPAQYFAAKFNVDKARIVRFAGFSRVDDTTYEKDKTAESSD